MSYILKKTVSLNELFFLIAYLPFLFISILKRTTFNTYINNDLLDMTRILMLIFVIIKSIFFVKYSIKSIIFYVTIISILGISYFSSSYSNLLEIAILLLGAKGVELKKIIKYYFIVASSIIVIAFLASNIGLIENLQFVRPDGKIRNSFGVIYVTDFAAYIFFVVLSWCYFKNRKLGFTSKVFIILLSFFIFIFCDARLDTICLLLVVLVFGLLQKYNFKSKFINVILQYCFTICTIISISLTYFYYNNSNNSFIIFLNSLLNQRLKYGAIGIEKYGFSLFGNYIEMRGLGGTTGEINNYFYIDSSYLQIGLKYGLVLLIVLNIIYAICCSIYIREKNIKLLLILMLISINSIIAHHFMDITYNPFIFMLIKLIEQKGDNKLRTSFPKRLTGEMS